MRDKKMPAVLLCLGTIAGLAAAPAANAQTPEDALSAAWLQVCASAPPGSALAQRCAEIAAGGPGARAAAAAGNFLDEIPGQGRSSTRGQTARDDEQRVQLSADLALYLSADVGRLDRSDSPNEAAFQGNTGSVTVGFDWAIHPKWLLGAALSHDQERLDFDASNGKASGDYTGGIGYLAWMPSEALGFNVYYGGLQGSNDITRAIDYTLASGTHVTAISRAAPDSQRTIAGAGADWNLARGAWAWDFGAGLDYTRTRLDNYTESGGQGLALSVPERTIRTRQGRLDASLLRNVSTNWGVWQPQFKLGWRHEFANPARALTVHFDQDPSATPIVFDTEDPDANWGEWALGSVFVLPHGQSGFLQYRQRFGHAFLQERVFALGWRIELK